MVSATVAKPSGFSDNSRRTVLVVEDEEGIRFCTTEFLRDCGFTVLEAETVAEAKSVLLQNRVDLVFSDVNLPNRETGFALEKWVRRQLPQIKVLLTSGAPQATEDTRDLLEPLISKPYKLSMLEGRIEQLLCRSHSLVA